MSDAFGEKRNMDSEKITSYKYSEKMTSLIVKMYDSPDEFFSVAQKIYLENYLSWLGMEKVRTIANLFRDAYRAYPIAERKKLGDRFLSFTRPIKMEEKQFSRLFGSFWLLMRKRPEAASFLVKAIKDEHFTSGVNEEFVEEYNSAENPLLREIFASRIEQIADYLSDSTFLYIAENSLDQYTLFDMVIYALLKRKKEAILIAFLKNKNILISKECYEKIISFAKKEKLFSLLKFAYHNFLFANSVNFSTFYQYYSLLSDEEKEEQENYLLRVVEANHLEKPYLLIQGGESKKDILKYLTLDEFASLSSLIKEKYKNEYADYLLSALGKRCQRETMDSKDIDLCISCYPEMKKELLFSPALKEYSFKSEEKRKDYLLMLIKENLMKESSLVIYQGENHVSD